MSLESSSQTLQSKIAYLFDAISLKFPSVEYLRYITPPEVCKIIIHNSNIHFNLKNKILWDMFAGIGTDSIRFAQHSGIVVCTELNSETFKCLEANVKSLETPKTNIRIYNKDCCDLDIEADVVYFDPPWGESFVTGANFSLKDVQLKNGMKIGDLFKLCHAKYDMIVKVPFLCDDIEQLTMEDNIISIITFSRQKLKYVFLKKLNSDLEIPSC